LERTIEEQQGRQRVLNASFLTEKLLSFEEGMPVAAEILSKYAEWGKEVEETRILKDDQRKFLVSHYVPPVHEPFSKGWVEAKGCNPTLETDERLLRIWLDRTARMPGTRGLPDKDWWIVAESLPALAIVGEWLRELEGRKW
jgi:hypothetical protein